jgi:hypothetical protein
VNPGILLQEQAAQPVPHETHLYPVAVLIPYYYHYYYLYLVE